MTVALLQVGNHYAALGMSDQIRPQSIDAIKDVRTKGIREIHLFTGDNHETAAVIAKQAGVDDFIAQMSPEDKEHNIAAFADQGKKVMMVGDGVNDAPALARAHVGVAMGGLGSDVALEASDIVLMDDRLEKIPQIIALGRKTGSIIKTNLIFATGVMAVLSIGSIIVDAVAPQYRNLLLPFAVVGHEGSTVLVILNGLRMLNGPGKS
ncbi:MAG: HAD-IC family P-type ATPase [Fimbriimonadaceae bacterium]